MKGLANSVSNTKKQDPFILPCYDSILLRRLDTTL